ncbi:hypothetical protein ACLKA7_000939 [Drosophila subpalustris]
MTVQVRQYVLGCETCKETKHTTQITRPPMGKEVLTDRPMQKLYLDFLGKYPRSRKGNAYILIALDHFTKFVWLRAITNATALATVKILKDEIFSHFGVPEVIHTDNGKQFTSQEFAALMQHHGIKHLRTGNYSAQANASERVNQSVLAAIRTHVNEDKTTWDEKLCSPCEHRSVAIFCHVWTEHVHARNGLRSGKETRRFGGCVDSTVGPLGKAANIQSQDPRDIAQGLRESRKDLQFEDTKYKLISVKSNSEELSNIFPLEKEEDLLRLEEAISPESQIKYVTAMKKILAPVGIKKGLPRILSEAIVEKYNIHGVKQKKGLKSLPKFYRALLDSIPDSASGDVEEELRLALMLISVKSNSEELSNIFPLEKEEDLLRLEEAISPESQIKYVTAMKKILAPVGIKKGLPRILSEAIVEKYNIHGVKQKKGLKSLPKFYRALLDSIPDSASGDVEEELRLALMLISVKSNSEELSNIFPLEKEEDLLRLEEAISPESQIKYVTAMKKILAPVGIKKGLPRILSEAIVEKYNIHGVKQKKGLKSLPKFYRALLDSIPDSASGDVEEELRLALMLISVKSNSEELSNIFPLEKEEDLLRLEEAISPESQIKYVTAMKKILAPVGIKKGLPRILSEAIVEKYNIHGVKQKKGLKSLPKFYRALLDSIPDSASGDVEEELRLALMVQKKTFHKKQYLKRESWSRFHRTHNRRILVTVSPDAQQEHLGHGFTGRVIGKLWSRFHPGSR